MERRHQVFVSSTYTDLVEERNEIMQALLELECMPAGMELFPAANETQWNWIKKVIDESDYYIVVVAGRYGTVAPDTGMSYTEMEYRYALEINKPIIGFVHEAPSGISAKFTESSPGKIRKLEAFRELVKSKLCKLYSSPSDLGSKVSRSITQLKKQFPASGWIKASILDTLATSDEVLKIKKENEELKEKLYRLGLERPKEADILASGKEKFEVEFRYQLLKLNPETQRHRKHSFGWASVPISWDEMFATLGPSLLEKSEYSYNHPSTILSRLVETKASRSVNDSLGEDYAEDFTIAQTSLDTILHQFRALKLIVPSRNGGWELTVYGDNYLMSLIGVPKGQTRRV